MSKVSEKRKANFVIWLFLSSMLLIPLGYYTVREDPYDERFAWRMFSSTGLAACEPRWMLGDPATEIVPGERFHMAWVKVAQTGQRLVVQRMTEYLCQKNPGLPVRLQMSCRHLDGRTDVLFDGTQDLCGGKR